jgi:hypothetical protein
MVVIEGPRFSTPAESRAYADAGWTLINMTAMPEAALARELRMCYAQPGAAHRPAHRHRRRAALAGRLHVLDLGGRPVPDLRDPVRVLLTGSAGFIGSAIGRRWTTPVTTWCGST